MPGLEADEQTKEEKLKAALWYSTGQTVDSIALTEDLNATAHFIGGLGELVWAQIENVAQDLEAFAKHSGRSTINTKDVILLGRRNDTLTGILRDHSKSVSEREETKNGR